MKNIIMLSLILLSVNKCFSQDTIVLNRGLVRELALYGGYTNNYGDTANNRSHIIEVGIWKSKYVQHVEPVNFNYYLGNEFLFHDNNLIIGPKIGSYFGFWMFCFGADLIYYTNFNENALRLTPYLGFGAHSFKLAFNFHINIINKEFQYVNPMGVSLAIQLKSLRKKEGSGIFSK